MRLGALCCRAGQIIFLGLACPSRCLQLQCQRPLVLDAGRGEGEGRGVARSKAGKCGASNACDVPACLLKSLLCLLLTVLLSRAVT